MNVSSMWNCETRDRGEKLHAIATKQHIGMCYTIANAARES